MEELLFCYLNLNDKKSYRFILRAFVDLIVVLRENSSGAPAKSRSARSDRKETESEGFHQPHPTPHHPHHHHPHHAHHQFSPTYSFRSPHPSGYLHVTPPSHHHHQRPLPLPSTSREDKDVLNPSSGEGGGGGGSGGAGGSKKRFRTKFTQDQKEKMLAFAERLGWRI
ncbi:zinc-finger homeodomain protein 2-like [Coffea eugenioides]|uniref:zinc-finger homeodomain protein 2-like n=1 Tax=Coffea eugenioides TaxID=49369 RepID=UPI000F5C7FB9|nr:zinc-finger homeodomain protein 2-like [Coffea arabica]XP_027184179.1 zinc-finger homeodomain protein 2-like [Coffea eugenioides]